MNYNGFELEIKKLELKENDVLFLKMIDYVTAATIGAVVSDLHKAGVVRIVIVPAGIEIGVFELKDTPLSTVSSISYPRIGRVVSAREDSLVWVSTDDVSKLND